MAYDVDTHWVIRSDGDNDNGSGFADLNPGTSIDYSNQAAAQASFTDLAMTTGGTTLTSASAQFTAEMEGNCIYIKSGTHFNAGYYQINGFNSATSVEIDQDATDGSSASGGLGKVGGGRATITDAFLEGIAAGNTVYVMQGSYTLAADLDIGKVGTTSASINLFGYTVEVGDYPRGDTRPLIDCDTYDVLFPNYWRIRGLRFTLNNTQGLQLTGIANMIINCRVDQTASGGHGVYCNGPAVQGMRVLDCHIVNTGGAATGAGVNANAYNVFVSCCKIWDFATGILVAVDQHSMISDGNIIDTCTDSGIELGANRAYIRWTTIYNCGIGVNGNTWINTHIRNCLIDTCTNGVKWTGAQIVFMDYNNWNGNGTDISGAGVTKGSHATAFDPLFTNAAGGNFALQAGSPVIQAGARIRVGVG